VRARRELQLEISTLLSVAVPVVDVVPLHPKFPDGSFPLMFIASDRKKNIP